MRFVEFIGKENCIHLKSPSIDVDCEYETHRMLYPETCNKPSIAVI